MSVRSFIAVAAAVVAIAALAACSKSAPEAPPPAKPELVAAPPNVDVAMHVAEAVAWAKPRNRKVLVYVGAAWCEPCRVFHDAVASGALDEELANVRLLEFDLDRDEAALEKAGYRSELVPLFARPLDDGRASGKQIEGAVKGDKALLSIMPRLRALVAGTPIPQ